MGSKVGRGLGKKAVLGPRKTPGPRRAAVKSALLGVWRCGISGGGDDGASESAAGARPGGGA